MRFAAIDFETASHEPNSACQVGVVVVEKGKIEFEKSWLIRPSRLYFSERCIAVHGIRPRDVLGAPTWPVVWKELLPILENRIVIAHNAPFDMNVLLHSILGCDEIAPKIEFQCTRLIARRTWPGRTGYGLHPTALSLGIQFQHHDALEDARACAQIATASCEHVGADSIESLESILSIARGCIEHDSKVSPKSINRKKRDQRNSLAAINAALQIDANR
jgi:DNA polymerase-3 subunit epsilon